MPDARRVLISGYYGYANPGDEAILSVLVTQLRERLSGVLLAVVSGRPEETAAAHNVEAVLWSDPAAIAEAVRSSDLVITGGGGLFHDYGGVSPQGLFTEGNWGIAFHCTAGLLAALYSKPHAICGVGVGPLFSEQAREMTRVLCETAATISVRDEASLRLLEEIGVSHAVLAADPAFLFEPSAIVSVPKRTAVVVRQWSHGVEQDQWEDGLASALDQHLERQGGEVLFLPFQQFPGEAEDDVAASRRVLERMRLQQFASIQEGTPPVGEKAAILAGSRLVVAMRLHAVIFALRQRVPVIALTYDEKVRQVVRRAGVQGIDMPAIRADVLCQEMDHALQAPPPDVSSLRRLAAQTIDLAVEAISRGPHPLPTATMREAFESLLAEQKRLRNWLRDQGTNFEYEVRTLKSKCAGQEQQLAVSAAQIAQFEEARTSAEQQLEETRADLEFWRSSANRLDKERVAALDNARAWQAELNAWKKLYQEAARDWDAYSMELDRRLAEYRPQRAWRAMLAIRKAYVLAARQGLRGKLRLLPWAISLVFGGGAVETEQLEFPQRPKLRRQP